jgi:hypothetical protein
MLLTACGGGGSSSTPDETQTTDDTVPDTTVDITGQPAFYVLVNGSSNTSYYSEYDLSISSDTNHILKIVPDADVVTEVAVNTSYDYATSSIVPATENGQAYIIKTTGLESSDDHTIKKVDPITDNLLWSKSFYSRPISNTNHLAIINNLYFFETYRTYDNMYGWTGGEFYKADLSTDDTVVTNTELDESVEVSMLDTSLDTLYDIRKVDDQLVFRTRNLQTGEVESIVSDFTITDDANYESLNYSFDVDRDGKVYMVRYLSGTTSLELWQFDFNADDVATLLKTFDAATINDHYVDFDVDNGYCMFANVQTGEIFIYNANTGAEKIYDLGIELIRIEMLYID